MSDFTAEELAKMRAKEMRNKAVGDAKAKQADDALVNKAKDLFGMGQPAPAPMPVAPQGQAMKKGGKVMEHKHNVDHVKEFYGKDHKHMHEQDKVSKHKETHKMHHEHVKAMHKGGKC